METSQQILVIILSTALAVLLILAIVISVLAIRLLKAIGRITEKAEHIVESAEQVGEAFSNATGSLALFKVIRNIAQIASKYTGNKKG